MAGPLLIADVPWLLYRSFFALPKSITDARGRPVNALLGTVNALLAALDAMRREAPSGVVACMGAEEAVYRVRLYSGYHAHREPMPPELSEQWKRAPELLEAIGWTFTSTDELEADDVMFSYARGRSERGDASLLLSGDRDLYGAVDERASVLEQRGRGAPVVIGPSEVRERVGVRPDQVADLISLRGDPSDGIPGAPGVGAKTAATLLRVHETLDGVLAAAREAARPRVRRETRPGAISQRIAAALIENEAMLRDFKEIATLQRIDVAPPREGTGDFDAGAAAAERLGMRNLAGRLRALASSS
jgi:5'-3' exonuclease